MAILYENTDARPGSYDKQSRSAQPARWAAQSFTPQITHKLSYLRVGVGDNSSAGDMTVNLYATDVDGKPTGSSLGSVLVPEANIPMYNSDTWVTCTLDKTIYLESGTKYIIVIAFLSMGGGDSWIIYHSTSNPYSGGSAWTTEDSGAAWTEQAGTDFSFEVWGTLGIPSDRTVVKKLVVAAKDKLYYEDSAGSMVEVPSSSIDTTEQVAIFEAFQKVIVVNGTNLKIIDFVNTKIDLGSGNELTDPPAKGDILTQLNSGATMIVDFVDKDKRYIYGFTTAGTFVTTAGYTMTSNNGIATMNPSTAPKPDVVSEASTAPHWYDYKTYPDIVLSTDGFGQSSGATKSFGSLPSKAYVGCLYRGRVVLGGNPNYPHQWYMSRQAYPWDFAYVASDAQSPVVGNNADAGELGDILISLIPYKDDYLIYGCANSMWFLRGDATAGGSLSEIDLTVGQFGAGSWCFDGAGNMYFWGTEGLYIIPRGFGPIQNLTENNLPNIVNDEAADPTTHRITLGYDSRRRGILVCITKVSDGSNSNYWYDLRTGGFFPESYPDACGNYAMFHYAATNKTYADLLMACHDGYIRKFLDSAKDDDSGASETTAINSYCVLPIQPLGFDGDHKGRLTSLTITTAGGGTGGNFGDTDGLSYRLYSANNEETALEKTKALLTWATGTVYTEGNLRIHSGIEYLCIVGHTSDSGGPPYEAPDTNTTDWVLAAQEYGTVSGAGRQQRIRKRISGGYLGIKLSNSTASKTWAIEKISGEIQPKGRLR